MSIRLVIDGQSVTARRGMTVLEAAGKAGIRIPTLCRQPGLPASGGCRMCLVEIEGMRGFPTSCTTPASEGMVVKTRSKALNRLRRHILELTLSEHPYTCLVCDHRTDCDDYQKTIRKSGVVTGCQNCPKNGSCELQTLARDLGLESVPFPVDYRNRPVENEDPFFDRDYNLCILCGRCVRQCQEIRLNGTLAFGYRGSRMAVTTPFGWSHLDTGCEFCGACVDVCPTGALYDKESKWEGPPLSTLKTVCGLCSAGCEMTVWKGEKGRPSAVRSHGVLPARGQLCARGRFAALRLLNSRERVVQPLVKEGGRWVETGWDDALNRAARAMRSSEAPWEVWTSPFCSNEEHFALQEWARRGLKTPFIQMASDWAGEETARMMRHLAQRGGVPSYEEWQKSGCLMLWGSHIGISHPIVSLMAGQAAQKGVPVITVNHRGTAPWKESLSIPLIPGLEGRFADLLMQAVSGKGTVARAQAAALGVEWSLFNQAVEWLGRDTPVILAGADALTGQVPAAWPHLFHLADRLKGHLVPVMGEGNWMGGLWMGCHPQMKPGWKEADPGKPEGTPRRILAFEDAPVLSDAELTVLMAVYRPGKNHPAGIVLPVPHWMENRGTAVNLEGRIQTLRPCGGPEGPRPAWRIVHELAKRNSVQGFDYNSFTRIRNAMKKAVYGLDAGSVKHVWPRKRRKEAPLLPGKAPVRPGSRYPYILVWGDALIRSRGVSLMEVPGMEHLVHPDDVEVNPEDARKLKVRNGAEVRLISKQGETRRRVRILSTIRPGTLFTLRKDPQDPVSQQTVYIEKDSHE